MEKKKSATRWVGSSSRLESGASRRGESAPDEVYGISEGGEDDISDIADKEVAEEGEESGDEAGESGEREVKQVKEMMKPSKDKVEAHERTHLPFRSWCEACVKGRGKEEACRKQTKEDDDRGLPEVHFDFCFPKHEDEERMIVLCGREKDTRMTLSSAVPSKST